MDTLRVGDRGKDVGIAQWLLVKNRYGYNFNPGPLDRIFGEKTGRASQRAKWRLGYKKENCRPTFGAALMGILVERNHPRYIKRSYDMQLRGYARRLLANPYAEETIPTVPWPFRDRKLGVLNGCPYQGTHTLGNWQSDRAIDLNVRYGTPVVALYDGTIGPMIGPLDTSNPALLGQRLYLIRSDGEEFYYAHLSRIDVRPGQHVKRGDELGLSGSANGVAHLHLAQMRGLPNHTLGVRGCG